MTKICTKCLQVKPLAKFHKDISRTDGHRDWCKVCVSKYSRQYYEENKERRLAASREYRAAHVEQSRKRGREYWAKHSAEGHNARLQRNYGITLADYNEMLEEQGGSCAICSRTPEEEGKRLCVDHDHETGEIRGLLCSDCNFAIAYLLDSPKLCNLAGLYLQKYKEAQ